MQRYFKSWKEKDNEKYDNFRTLEIMINYDCNLACKYCYGARYGECTPKGNEGLYSSKVFGNKENIMKNLHMLLNWIKENKYSPHIELFSGEPFYQSIGFEIVELIIDELSDCPPDAFVIPTNFTFLLSDKLTEEVERLISKGKEKNVPMYLSSSFDGKLIEQNRPFKHTVKDLTFDHGIAKWEYKKDALKDPRDDAYYDRVFGFCKKYEYGFHPMIYSENVNLWKDNFLWFQKMFKKYEIPFHMLYLLEIRNPEWSDTQIKQFGEFVEFLIKWSWDRVGCNFNNYVDFLFQGKGFNILNSPLGSIGRGLGCGFQSGIYTRLGDLSIVPCHRTCYPPLNYGYFDVKDEKIIGVRSNNIEFMIAALSADASTFPYCEQCVISPICPHGCLGAQIEATGDPFTPIPSVCKLEHEKIKVMIKTYREIGILEGIYNKINKDKSEAFKYMEKVINSETK